MAVAVVLAALLGGLVGFLVGRPDATTRAVDAIRAGEARRDVQQIQELTVVARRTQAALTTLLTSLDAAVNGVRPAAEPQVRGWQTTMAQLVEQHAQSPSGSTATNVARGGFRDAVGEFAVAVDLFATAQRTSADQRPALIEIVKRSRVLAATTWSVAAAQLDQINIDAGMGHQHVYLQTESGAGAFTADGEPEGKPGG